jgi:hypothetical protein
MWKVRFTNDTDNQKVGTLHAVWNDIDAAESLTVTDRFDDTKDLGKFIERCRSELIEYQEKQKQQSDIALKVEGALNG